MLKENKIIRTVTGDINGSETGNVLMHEHIRCASYDMIKAFGKRWLDDERLEEYSVSILKELKKRFGVDIFVDGTPSDLRRDVDLFKRISQRSGVHIVASTGFYLFPSMISSQRTAEDLANWLLLECESGMDGTDITPGILKCAADGQEMSYDSQKRVSALSIVQHETGLPLYAHCSHKSPLTDTMTEIFERYNANPEQIILGHASRKTDPDYLEKVLSKGYYICIDQSFDGSEEKVSKAVYELCRRGFEDKILFSHDRSLYNDFEATDRTGLDYPEQVHIQRFAFLFERLIPKLKEEGCTDAQIEKFTCKNAIKVLEI